MRFFQAHTSIGKYSFIILSVFTSILASSCARVGQPDGGWFDETPPRVIKCTPEDKSANVNTRKVNIYFDEFIKIDNPTEKVVVSPPQLEAPEIKAAGKRIEIKLNDSLKANTTYTVDFSDAITDNNEGNPMGNYTYSFSTGPQTDTLEVSGNVLEAENLEPVKGILVGLYSDTANISFTQKPMLRVARTDARGRFVIKGIAPGTYRIYALQDTDGNYMFNQKSEKIAFTHETITPTFKGDIRQDTIWKDSLHIKDITRTGYTRFMPDDIVLKAFTEKQTNRYFLKSERKEPDRFTLFFSYGNSELPQIKGLNFNSNNAFVIESSPRRDTVTYWLRDTALINTDSLEIKMTYMGSDSTGVLIEKSDTLQLIPKVSYAKRLKFKQQETDEWKKKQEKLKKKGEPFDSIMPPKKLVTEIKPGSQLDPDKNMLLSFETPIARIDTSKIHLYSKRDTLWYVSRFALQALTDTTTIDEGNRIATTSMRVYKLLGEWKPGIEYSLEMDSLAFEDIYGRVSGKEKRGFKVKATDEYGTILLTINGMKGKNIVVQLLDNSDKPIKETVTNTGVAEFFYVDPKTYYLRMFEDRNNNGKWDTGDYTTDTQPEEVYYYPDKIECRAKWDITETWNPTITELTRQKPSAITKQKSEKEKTVRHRNADRAREKGIQYTPKGN